MKILKNYRYYVIELLFTLGMLSALVASGNPVQGMTARCWILIVICALIVSIASFGGVALLICVWKDEIPELTKLVRKED